ncbi:MAG: hypothetical protein HY507_02010 [Candidatus Zambryskibacteria bacterium]|nr:hypothetical protein [Candidatus Zambryskibacteria bacterium]
MNFGVIFRSYAKTPEVVSEVVQRAVNSARKASELEWRGQPVFERVLILVPKDHDCGETFSKIESALKENQIRATAFEAFGHHSTEALNAGLRWLDSLHVQYATILSNKALDYLTLSVMENVTSALTEGNKVVGVQISELDDAHIVPVENTFCTWDIEALQSVQGFDSKIGVEEIAPIVRLTRKYGRCTKIISPGTEAKLNIRQSSDGVVRHKEVKDTKKERQKTEALRLDTTIEWILENIS